jgi:dipeptidyl aminopeptidase/acylaminoacyl peptidase
MCGQALRILNIGTQLVSYPNEFHGITPSYVRDRYERYLAWYESHINGKKPTAPLTRFRC